MQVIGPHLQLASKLQVHSVIYAAKFVIVSTAVINHVHDNGITTCCFNLRQLPTDVVILRYFQKAVVIFLSMNLH